MSKGTPAYTLQHKREGPEEDSNNAKRLKPDEQGSVSIVSDESVEVKFSKLKEMGVNHRKKVRVAY